jgi:rhodanese-related sulfurtransferase
MKNAVQLIRRKSWILISAGLILAGLCGPLCVQAQDTTAGKTIPKKKFERLKKKNTVLLDVRSSDEYKAGHIPNAVQIDVLNPDNFKKQIAGLDKNKKYLVYCRTAKRSKTAMGIMKQSGFTRLYDLKGGFSKWEGAKEKQP